MSDSDSDDEEYVYYGTPLVGEKTVPHYAHPAGKSDPSKTVALPVHQQQVRDAQGRQRLHGAFEGGFSAGFFNSVGSVEGFQPAAFRSSRSERGPARGQQYTDFLDVDELEELERKGLRTAADYDTFGEQAHAAASKHAAEADRHRVAEGAPRLIPEELLRPVANSIGIQLLQKMGWRQGRGIGTREAATLEQMGYSVGIDPVDAAAPAPRRRRWGPEASLQAENAPIHTLVPKRDLHGLGYDPYSNAEEIREMRKRGRAEEAPHMQGKRQRGVAFAPSVLEESDVYGGELADYVDDADLRIGYANEIVSDASDDDVPAASSEQQARLGGGAAAPLSLKARIGTMGNDSFIEGFVRGELAEPPRVYAAPALPPGFRTPQHQFAHPCPLLYGAARSGTSRTQAVAESQPAPAPPSDAALKQRIDVLAATVARGGAAMEAFAQKQHRGDQDYDFLDGGLGNGYYQHRVASIRAALQKAGAAGIDPALPKPSRLTVDQRAAALGEDALRGNRAPDRATAVPGVRESVEMASRQAISAHPGVAGQGIQRGAGLLSRVAAADIAAVSRSFNSRFVKAGTLKADAGGWTTAATAKEAEGEAAQADVKPVRTQQDWRPEALLCRRFNVADPYGGKAAQLQPPQHRIDYLALPETQRADAYAASLPAFMRPPEATAELPSLPPRGHATEHPPHGGPGTDLPPPPPRPGAAHVHAPQTATELGDRPPMDAADALLAELDAEQAQEEEAVEAPPPVVEPVPVEKPMDIFKAIFENSDEDDSGDDDATVAAGATGASPAAAPERESAQARVTDADAQAADGVRTAEQRDTGHTDLAAALLRAQTEMAEQAAAAARSRQADAGSVRPAPSVGLSSDEGSGQSGASSSSDDGRHDRAQAPVKSDKKSGRASTSKQTKRSREELLQEALATVQSDVARRAVSTEQIQELLRSLKKEKEKRKHRKEKRKYKKEKHKKSKDRKHKKDRKDDRRAKDG